MMTLSSTPGGGESPVWLITFADLVGLMLCFFVMLFSMSTIEEGTWKRIAGALDNGPTDRASQADSPAIVDRNMSATLVAEGRDVGYLASLLRERLSEDATLGSIGLLAEDDRVSLLLPDGTLGDGGASMTRGGAGPLLAALAGVLRNVPNRIVVDGYVDPNARDVAQFQAAWSAALSRADAVARSLSFGGYPVLPDARARVAGAASGSESLPLVGAVAIVVLESGEVRP